MGVSIDKTSIKVSKTKERLNFFNISGHRPRSNSFKFLGVHSNAISTDYVTQVLNFGFVELTLCGISTNLSITKPIENFGHMYVMFSLRMREDEDVIKVNNAKNVKKVSKSVLDEGLESSRCIRKSIRGN